MDNIYHYQISNLCETLVSICKYRRYIVPDSFLTFAKDATTLRTMTKTEIDDALNIFIKDADDKIIMINVQHISLCLDCIKKTEKKMNEENIHHVIFIIFIPDNQRMISTSLDEETLRKKGMEVFSFFDLLYNPVEHVMSAMNYTVISGDELQYITTKICDEKKLHKILITDPVIRFLGAKVGDIIRTNIYSQSIGKTVVYKHVILE